MTPTDLEALRERDEECVALALWHARERRFPERVRRMNPDAMDKTTGAWALCIEDARAALSALIAQKVEG